MNGAYARYHPPALRKRVELGPRGRLFPAKVQMISS